MSVWETVKDVKLSTMFTLCVRGIFDHVVPLTWTWNGGPRQKIGSSDDSLFALALKTLLASSITAAATKVYSPGTRKYKEKPCLVSSSGGTSMVIPLRTPDNKLLPCKEINTSDMELPQNDTP